ncbi:hydroxyproline O-galactosyltransferase GALT6-like isoform X2 [Glycine soja]|uniref:hydroxyproline O-galactosyltransferase GALT6-like isoform X2 n=1 Tax=Glycine soja TaxID=3848 RepID=UPI00103A65CE|nr:hydroxyproline O-galactosyltransferase GALT6-like isoform X2 [Glycine soja]
MTFWSYMSPSTTSTSKASSGVARMLKDLSLRCQEVHTISAVMKGDDDTFVRVDAVIDEARKVPDGTSFYIRNINYYHKPFRYGKCTVTYEV